MASTSTSTDPTHDPSPELEPDHDNDPPLATPLPLLIPASTAVVVAAPPPFTRRLPPPCWTPDETSALIDAYRDKWYSLRRGNLRAAHWQEVADEIHRRCPDVSPPKTAVQCRHKMEKLRKRYRAELLRAKSIPHHRFSSSWIYFSKMDSMEKGLSLSSPPPPSTAIVTTAGDLSNDVGGLDDDDDDDEDDDHLYNQQPNAMRIKVPNSRYRENPNPNPNSNYGYRSKYGSINSFSSGTPPQLEDSSRYAARAMRNGVGNGGNDGSGGMETMMMKKKKRKLIGKREKEEDGADTAAMEMVEAIRMMGEGFVRMEKMKMEIMRETEKMRMDMEMKRTQMILESQHRMVEAFAKAWCDSIDAKNNTTSKDDASC